MTDGLPGVSAAFTSRGLQYIEITGVDAPLPLEDVQGCR